MLDKEYVLSYNTSVATINPSEGLRQRQTLVSGKLAVIPEYQESEALKNIDTKGNIAAGDRMHLTLLVSIIELLPVLLSAKGPEDLNLPLTLITLGLVALTLRWGYKSGQEIKKRVVARELSELDKN